MSRRAPAGLRHRPGGYPPNVADDLLRGGIAVDAHGQSTTRGERDERTVGEGGQRQHRRTLVGWSTSEAVFREPLQRRDRLIHAVDAARDEDRVVGEAQHGGRLSGRAQRSEPKDDGASERWILRRCDDDHRGERQVVLVFTSHEKRAAVGENGRAVTCTWIAERDLLASATAPFRNTERRIDHLRGNELVVDAARDQRVIAKRSCARPGTAIRAELPRGRASRQSSCPMPAQTRSRR